MKNTTRKTPELNNNVVSLLEYSKSKARKNYNLALPAAKKERLFMHEVRTNLFYFQPGDKVICRDYLGEDLLPTTIVIAETDGDGKNLTTAANASKILAVVVAFRREVLQ